MSRSRFVKEHRPASYGLKQTHLTAAGVEAILHGAPLPDLARQKNQRALASMREAAAKEVQMHIEAGMRQLREQEGARRNEAH
jgi:hypothetical protein